MLQFAPDGRIFVGQKNGVIKVFQSLTDTNPVTVADLSGKVDDYWDRGLLGMALPPNFPSDPYVYVLYAYDAPIGGTAPTWNDGCPTPPGPTTDGCLVSGRLSRLQISGNVMTGGEQVLINDWCQQFPSHSIGTLLFGRDGYLYGPAATAPASTTSTTASSGPPTPVTGQTRAAIRPVRSERRSDRPNAEGGALRSQSLRRPTVKKKKKDHFEVRYAAYRGCHALASAGHHSGDGAGRRARHAGGARVRLGRPRCRPGFATRSC